MSKFHVLFREPRYIQIEVDAVTEEEAIEIAWAEARDGAGDIDYGDIEFEAIEQVVETA